MSTASARKRALSSSRVTPFGRTNNFFAQRRDSFEPTYEGIRLSEGVLAEGSFVAALAQALRERGDRFFVARGIHDGDACWALALDRTTEPGTSEPDPSEPDPSAPDPSEPDPSAPDQWSTYVCDASTETMWRLADEVQRPRALALVVTDLDEQTPVSAHAALTAGEARRLLPGDASAVLLALAAGWRADRIAEGCTPEAAATMVALLLPPTEGTLLEQHTLASSSLT